MKMRFATIAGLVFALSPLFAHGQLYRPSDPSEIIEHVGGSGLQGTEIGSSNSFRNTVGVKDLTDKAEQAIRTFRETGDRSSLIQARRALHELETREGGRKGALILGAVLLQIDHDFDGALAKLDEALAIDRSDPQAWVIKASIHTLRLEGDAARSACARVISAGNELVSLACLAGINGMTGSAKHSLDGIRTALKTHESLRGDSSYRWASSIASDIAQRIGEFDSAESLLRSAPGVNPYTPSELIQLADLLIERGNWGSAIDLTKESRTHDAVFLREMIARKRSNDSQYEVLKADLKERMEAFELADARQHARELAMYYLDIVGDAKKARDFAVMSASYQKETIDVRLLERSARAADDAEIRASLRKDLDRIHYEDVAIGRLANGAK